MLFFMAPPELPLYNTGKIWYALHVVFVYLNFPSIIRDIMSNIEKQCVVCGQSCVGQPRIKDNQGHYAHKACAEKAAKKSQAKKAAHQEPELEPLALAPEDELEMDAFLDDLPSASDNEPTAGIRVACPGCGSTVSSDAIVCLNCGCNTKTGRGAKTKVVKAKPSKSGPNLAAKAGALTLAPVLPIIGASIGGAIGATIWLVVQIFTGYEIGLLAAGVGALCGIGAAIFSRGGNAWAGSVAVVIALISVFLGKILIATLFIAGGDFMREAIEAEMLNPLTADTITQDFIYERLIDEIAQDRIDRNIPIDWEDDITLEFASWPYDYPQDLVDETRERWESMTPEDQQSFTDDHLVLYNDGVREYNQELEDELAELDAFSLSDLFTFWDILWAFFAIGAAWQFGNGDD